MKKLLDHFKAMQDKARQYLEPGRYENINGVASLSQSAKDFQFGNDMVYMLDGPEQREAQSHAEFDYLALSERTASGEFYSQNVSMIELINEFDNFINAARNIDKIKKLLFYGERPEKGLFATKSQAAKADVAVRRLAVDFTDEQAEFIIHSVLGVASEAGEMVEALYKAVISAEKLDLTNLGEESGDVKWYLAMLARVRGVEWDADERVNIEKLKARFPDKFSTEKAHVRDLVKEREILEQGHVEIEHGKESFMSELTPEQKAD